MLRFKHRRVNEPSTSPEASLTTSRSVPLQRAACTASRGYVALLVVTALVIMAGNLWHSTNSDRSPLIFPQSSPRPPESLRPSRRHHLEFAPPGQRHAYTPGLSASVHQFLRQQQAEPKQVPLDELDSFSACLLIRDDNHFLIEWLLYHYFVLPLRHLIVLVDPASRTSPSRIFQRYRANSSLDIVEWTHDDDYSTAAEFAQAGQVVRQYFGADIGEDLILHRTRQRMFYYRCLLHHQRRNRTWVALLDSDEFLRINYQTTHRMVSSLVNASIRAPAMTEPGSVMKLLKQVLALPANLQHNYSLSTPCIQVPRVRFGSKESSTAHVQRGVPDSLAGSHGWNSSHLLTLRYRRHATSSDYVSNRISKALVDVSRLTSDEQDLNDTAVDLQPVTSIHRPVRKYCTQRGLHIRSHQQLFLVHHYLGSLDQHLYRDDPRLKQPELRGVKVSFGGISWCVYNVLTPVCFVDFPTGLAHERCV
jgi:hypothetical protein